MRGKNPKTAPKWQFIYLFLFFWKSSRNPSCSGKNHKMGELGKNAENWPKNENSWAEDFFKKIPGTSSEIIKWGVIENAAIWAAMA